MEAAASLPTFEADFTEAPQVVRVKPDNQLPLSPEELEKEVKLTVVLDFYIPYERTVVLDFYIPYETYSRIGLLHPI